MHGNLVLASINKTFTKTPRVDTDVSNKLLVTDGVEIALNKGKNREKERSVPRTMAKLYYPKRERCAFFLSELRKRRCFSTEPGQHETCQAQHATSNPIK